MLVATLKPMHLTSDYNDELLTKLEREREREREREKTRIQFRPNTNFFASVLKGQKLHKRTKVFR